MIINNAFELDQPAEEVFRMLLDLDAVAPCIPGATVGDQRADGSRDASIEVRFGPMRFDYAGSVRIADVDEPAKRAVLEAQAAERSGEGDANARITMQTVAAGAARSRVHVATDLVMTGGAAQM